MSKPKSSVPATTKALQAWQSELRRLEQRLEEWANDLAQREEILEEQEEAFATAVDGADGETVQLYADHVAQDSGSYLIDENGDIREENDCGCTPEDVEEGCDCPKCESVRHQERVATDQRKTEAAKAKKGVQGDEVQWLENLWKLNDKRKK
jgi:hypothetical protein